MMEKSLDLLNDDKRFYLLRGVVRNTSQTMPGECPVLCEFHVRSTW